MSSEEVEVESEELEPEQDLIDQAEELNHSALIEALIFTSGEPIGVGRIRSVTGLDDKEIRDLLEGISMKFELEDSGIRLFQVAGKYQFRTPTEFAPYIQQLKASRPRRLSQQALETLAIVAYRQPIVKSDVEKIRGVDATPTLKTLLDRGFVRIVGHQDTVGQPALYGTTDQFLKIFGLRSLAELPTLRDLKELEADPGEVDEQSDLSEEHSQQELEYDDESSETKQSVEAPLAANS